MGSYAATVSTPLKECERISRSLGVLAGKYNLTNYNTTLLKQTAITKYFVTGGVAGFTQGIIAVVPSGVSDNGHTLEWDYTTGAFKAYKPSSVTVDSDVSTGASVLVTTGQVSGVHATSCVGNIIGPALEAVTDVDCGEVSFVAIGFIR